MVWELHEIVSVEVSISSSPATMSLPLTQATAFRELVVPVGRLVHSVPSEEIMIRPPLVTDDDKEAVAVANSLELTRNAASRPVIPIERSGDPVSDSDELSVAKGDAAKVAKAG